MDNGINPPGGFPRAVHEKTQAYIRSLLTENERLRELIVSLETRIDTAERDLERTAAGSGDAETLAQSLAVLRGENATLRAKFDETSTALQRAERELAAIKERFTATQADNKRYAQQFIEVEAQNTMLANLYVASYRLHGSLDRREVLLAIREIVANLIGSEEFGVYEASEDGRSFGLVSSMGDIADRTRHFVLGEGSIGSMIARGDVVVHDDPGHPPVKTAIPLRLGDNITGAIVIFKLLGHKLGIEAADRELFQLLGTQAAIALYCSGLTRTRPASAMA